MRRFRRTLVRVVRFVILRPAALFGAGALLLAVVAATVLVPPALSGRGGLPGLKIALPRASVGEPTATAEFLRGNRDYDAGPVWESFSDEVRGQLEQRGAGAADIQQQMQAARERGYRIEDVSYVGNKGLPDGTLMAFYVVGVRQQTKADLEYVPYLFTLDANGKIVRVQ